ELHTLSLSTIVCNIRQQHLMRSGMCASAPKRNVARKPPTTDAFTSYDEEHMALYMSLLHARAEGVPDAEIARTLFGIDAASEPEQVRLSIEAHYQRALWL